MPELSRSQLVVYGAVAVALLLVGVRALRADAGPATAGVGAGEGAAGAAGLSVGSGGGEIVVDVSGAVRRPIGLGSATVEQLETIDGIGPVTAEKIIEYRDQHGGLASVEQLDDVSGIGPATMESLRARLQP